MRPGRFALSLTLLVSMSLAACAQTEGLERARERMVREQIEGRGVRDPRVLEAMRRVPRHLFLGASSESLAYADTPLPTEAGQTISQPYIVAVMTEYARPEKEHRVLEVGTGSGYQAAILSLLVKQVYTVELLPSLARQAAERLKRLGYTNVEVRQGDGWRGWPEHAPYDAILVTAAAAEMPAELVRQLKPGGRMVIPIGGSGDQDLVVVEKDAGGRVKSRPVMGVRFVPLVKPE